MDVGSAVTPFQVVLQRGQTKDFDAERDRTRNLVLLRNATNVGILVEFRVAKSCEILHGTN